MNEVDVFNKLSRILETHESENGSQDDVMDDLVNAFGDGDGKTTKTRNAPKVKLPDRPTPYEVWQAKQTKKDYAAKKAAENSKAKLTPAQVNMIDFRDL